MESKVLIYKTCIRPDLTYVAEIQADTSKAKRIIRTTEMGILRAIGEFTTWFTRNKAVKEVCDVQDVTR